MYDAHVILARVSHHVPLVLALGGLALICNYVFFWEAARLARRDRCVPYLPFATVLWFAHDGNYFLDYGKWFDTYDHWFPKLFWVGLIFTFAFETVFLRQTLQFGRGELAPRLSSAQFRVFLVAALALGVVYWTIMKHTLADPLYLMTFLLTATLALASNGMLAIRRGSLRGQSVLMWASFTLMLAAYGSVSIIVFGGEFRHLPWIALSVTGVGGGACMTWWAAHAVPYDGGTPDRSTALVEAG